VGLLPEEAQERACDRLGLYAVTATLVSGLVESLGVILVLLLVARTSEPGAAIMLLTSLPGLILLVLPGLGRAFGAVFLRETGGSRSRHRVPRCASARSEARTRLVPLTLHVLGGWADRTVDVMTARASSALLPHLSWSGSRRLCAGRDYWSVLPEPPVFGQGRLTYSYRLVPLGEPPAPGEPKPVPPPPTAYADEVLQDVQREWDGFHEAFAWLTSMLSADVQARAFAHRGGPAASRRATMATGAACGVLGLYLLSFLPGGPAADPLAPFVGALSLLLVADAATRIRRARQGRYAPSVLRFVLPSDSLRAERLAYHAHRDSERETLGLLDRGR
jgi:hypothetical protein